MMSVSENQDPKTTVWTYSGIRTVLFDDCQSLELGSGFSLTKPNEVLLSMRSRSLMSGDEYRAAETDYSYLIYKNQQPIIRDLARDEALEVFQHGLMAFQMLKPVQTSGLIFQCPEVGSSGLGREVTARRPPMDAGSWARMRPFDGHFLTQLPDLIPKVCQVMRGTNAEHKNSFFLLQLGLEHPHPLIAGLLCIMGIEARLDSSDRNDFEKKLCACLGASTLVFPDWNSPLFPQPQYTVEDLAIPIYMLRNKLAHGADLRKASIDKSTPVDLVEKVVLIPEVDPMPRALLLSQAAVYLLCQVLQKSLYA
jgi:hypothetical protein